MRHRVLERAVGYALQTQRMTAAGFLAWDATWTITHQLVRGELFMLAGGESHNNTVALAVVVALRQQLHGAR